MRGWGVCARAHICHVAFKEFPAYPNFEASYFSKISTLIWEHHIPVNMNSSQFNKEEKRKGRGREVGELPPYLKEAFLHSL